LEYSTLPTLTCPACGRTGTEYVLKENGQHTEARCEGCGAHIKFLSKADKYGTKEQQSAIWEKTRGRCGYCGDLLNPFAKVGYTYEHMEPQYLGGGHGEENLMACCKSCNSQKGKKTVEEYRNYIAEKGGYSKWVFYFEVQNLSNFGQLISNMYGTKKDKTNPT